MPRTRRPRKSGSRARRARTDLGGQTGRRGWRNRAAAWCRRGNWALVRWPPSRRRRAPTCGCARATERPVIDARRAYMADSDRPLEAGGATWAIVFSSPHLGSPNRPSHPAIRRRSRWAIRISTRWMIPIRTRTKSPSPNRSTIPTRTEAASLHPQSAAGVDHLAGDPAGIRGGEEGDGAGDVGGLADAAKGGLGYRLVEELRIADQHVRIGGARSNGVHGDAARTQFGGEGAREGIHGGLAGDVGAQAGNRRARADRRRVDHAA